MGEYGRRRREGMRMEGEGRKLCLWDRKKERDMNEWRNEKENSKGIKKRTRLRRERREGTSMERGRVRNGRRKKEGVKMERMKEERIGMEKAIK